MNVNDMAKACSKVRGENRLKEVISQTEKDHYESVVNIEVGENFVLFVQKFAEPVVIKTEE